MEIWTDRVQSLAKVFEVVGGIQVGFRRNSRGRIPLSLTRKYFSGISGSISLTFYVTINVNASRRISSKRRIVEIVLSPVSSIRAPKCRVHARVRRSLVSKLLNTSSFVIRDTFYNSMRVRKGEGGEGEGDGTKRTPPSYFPSGVLTMTLINL